MRCLYGFKPCGSFVLKQFFHFSIYLDFLHFLTNLARMSLVLGVYLLSHFKIKLTVLIAYGMLVSHQLPNIMVAGNLEGLDWIGNLWPLTALWINISWTMVQLIELTHGSISNSFPTNKSQMYVAFVKLYISWNN